MFTRKCYLALMGALLVSGTMTGCDKKTPKRLLKKPLPKRAGLPQQGDRRHWNERVRQGGGDSP